MGGYPAPKTVSSIENGCIRNIEQKIFQVYTPVSTFSAFIEYSF